MQVRRPTAFVPLAMSFVALAMVVGHFAIYGIVHETDEGTPAHVFQLLMILQGPIIGLFAVRWLRRRTAPDPANPWVSRRPPQRQQSSLCSTSPSCLTAENSCT